MDLENLFKKDIIKKKEIKVVKQKISTSLRDQQALEQKKVIEK